MRKQKETVQIDMSVKSLKTLRRLIPQSGRNRYVAFSEGDAYAGRVSPMNQRGREAVDSVYAKLDQAVASSESHLFLTPDEVDALFILVATKSTDMYENKQVITSQNFSVLQILLPLVSKTNPSLPSSKFYK